MVRDDIARRFEVATEKLHVITNGVDLEQFHPRLREAHRQALRQKLGVGETARVALFVGSGYARKGLPALLEAFASLAMPRTELWVVGRDRQEAAMQRRAEALLGSGRNSRVRFFGAQEDVRPFYGAADLFVLPTRYDPFPNAVLEALACGLPVITTTTCGAAERVGASHGAVIRAGDVTALGERLTALLAPGVSEAMHGAGGRRRSWSGVHDPAPACPRLISAKTKK